MFLHFPPGPGLASQGYLVWLSVGAGFGGAFILPSYLYGDPLRAQLFITQRQLPAQGGREHLLTVRGTPLPGCHLHRARPPAPPTRVAPKAPGGELSFSWVVKRGASGQGTSVSSWFLHLVAGQPWTSHPNVSEPQMALFLKWGWPRAALPAPARPLRVAWGAWWVGGRRCLGAPCPPLSTPA